MSGCRHRLYVRVCGSCARVRENLHANVPPPVSERERHVRKLLEEQAAAMRRDEEGEGYDAPDLGGAA